MNTDMNKLLLAAHDLSKKLEDVAKEYEITGAESAILEVVKAAYDANRPVTGLLADS